MPDAPKVLPREAIDQLLVPFPRWIATKVAALAFGPDGEKPRNVATVFCVEIESVVFLVTAKHVVECDSAREYPWWIVVPARDSSGFVSESPDAPPLVLRLPADSLAWSSPSLDVALIRPPHNHHLESFDGSAGAGVTTRLRGIWDEAAEKDAYRPVLISGFPNFAREVSKSRGDYRLVPLCAAVVNATRPAVESHEPPTLTLNIGLQTMRPEWLAEEGSAAMAARLANTNEGPDPLGGLSGAPVVLATESALLVATERRIGTEPLTAVHRDGAGTNALRDSVRAIE